MSYSPILQDACTDLLRAVNASLGTKGFKSEACIIFFDHARSIISTYTDTFSSTRRLVVAECLEKAQDESLELSKRQEKLLTLSSLLR